MVFIDYYTEYKWNSIRNCPGRYVLGSTELSRFNEYYLTLDDIHEYIVPKAADPVLVYTFTDGGLISFKHSDGFLVHTLSTLEGFKRKLDQLGIISL